MATNDESSRRPVLFVGLGAVLLTTVWLAYGYWSKPPQMGADPAVFTTVDALFTAVNARDEKLLSRSEQRLKALKTSGKLPETASSYLDSVIATARSGRWQQAAQTLYGFMRAQRRDAPAYARK